MNEPTLPPENADDTTEGSRAAGEPAARKRTRISLIFMLAVIAAILTLHFVGDRVTPYTSQARIDANVVPVAAQVSGQIIKVDVGNNQVVQKGDPLFEIDTSTYELAREQARADVDAVFRDRERGNAAVEVARANLAAVRASRDRAAVEANRLQALYTEDPGAISSPQICLETDMLKYVPFLAAALALPTGAMANAWKDNFVRWVDEGGFERVEAEPVVVPSAGDIDADIGRMYRQGMIPIGYTLFESGNDKTRDGERWGEELGASHIIVGVDLTSSRSASIPLTLPNTTTSTTNGNASVFGSSGSATGTFNSTTTTTENQTTYIPITRNRFAKSAIYFAPEPKFGAGIYTRQVSAEEMQELGTRFAIAVRYVRDFSPAYYADILPGDIILKINGKPADPNIWWAEILDGEPDSIEVIRRGGTETLSLVIPEEWRVIPSNAVQGGEETEDD